MKDINYQSYIRSPKWIIKREKFKKLAKKRAHGVLRCCICKSEESLHVHHKSYKSLGNEKKHDLCMLCSDCHYTVHSFINEFRSIGRRLGTRAGTNLVKKIVNKCHHY